MCGGLSVGAGSVLRQIGYYIVRLAALKQIHGDSALIENQMEEMTTDIPRPDACPKCGQTPLHSWPEMDDAEREIARRLSFAGAAFSLNERIARHRWCLRCWHEETGQAQMNA